VGERDLRVLLQSHATVHQHVPEHVIYEHLKKAGNFSKLLGTFVKIVGNFFKVFGKFSKLFRSL
jgi:hypothetical protein